MLVTQHDKTWTRQNMKHLYQHLKGINKTLFSYSIRQFLFVKAHDCIVQCFRMASKIKLLIQIFLSPYSCFNQIFMNMFYRPHKILVNMQRIVEEIDQGNRVSIWSYYLVLLCTCLTILRTLCLMVVRPGQDYGWVHLFFYDYLDAILGWNWATKLFLLVINCHVMVCFYLVFRVRPQMFAALKELLYDGKPNFFLSPLYKGQPVVERVQRASMAYLRILGTFPLVLSK